MGKRILGIDTGTNSLGWAVVEKQSNGDKSLIRKGSLIFQEGVNRESETEEKSKSAERTQYRSIRKQYFRRRLRKIEVLKVLIKYDWCPALTDEQLHLWHTKKQYPRSEAFMAWQRTNDNLEQNPYYYRHVCLHDELDLDNEAERYILGRAMYHLAQRRGFLSNRLDQNEDKDSGKVKEGIDNLSAEMAEYNCDYLGDFFYKLYKEKGNKVRIRTRYADREKHYVKEFYAICKKQKLQEEQIKELYNAIYYQRDLKSQKHSIGLCPFESRIIKAQTNQGEKDMRVGKVRCSTTHPLFERYRAWCFVNSIKVMRQGYNRLEPLTLEKRNEIVELILSHKGDFLFKIIAQAIAGKGKGKFQYIKDEGDCLYKFNYRMDKTVLGSPTTYALREIFGDDYRSGIAETYINASNKGPEQIENDIWNVLCSFNDQNKRYEYAVKKLQLDNDKANVFSRIKVKTTDYSSLSLSAIRRILPFLENGLVYSHAVFMGKVPDIVGKDIWYRCGEAISLALMRMMEEHCPNEEPIERRIKNYLLNNFDLKVGAADKLYHPSMIETYPNAKKVNGVYQLGSPQTNAIRNPMVMRSLHQLRKVVNKLLRDGVIDQNAEVHIEYARELNDANKRIALAKWNQQREKKRKAYRDAIIRLYNPCPTEKDVQKFELWVEQSEDIRKMELWEEQKHICLYTGKQIGITDFLCTNPKYDIEHTVPRSRGGDSTMMNLTLCDCDYNRKVKKTLLPSELPPADYARVMAVLETWKQHIETLRSKYENERRKARSKNTKEDKDKALQNAYVIKYELDYWQGKYDRFIYEETPKGFTLRQEVGIGMISKYAGLYLKSLFHDDSDNHSTNVRVVKGIITSEFRKMWGIQDEDEKKSRDNHIHHCIDAITIACIDADEYNKLSAYHKALDEHKYYHAPEPEFDKPWPTFTEDIKSIIKETLVVHDTPDNISKRAQKYVRTRKGKVLAKGDVAHGSLHKDKMYGYIERNGESCYVLRKSLTELKTSDVANIVDDVVRGKIEDAINRLGFNAAINSVIYMNEEKRIPIKKVRCRVPTVKDPLKIREHKHRDKSKNPKKNATYVVNENNYMMAVYEGAVNGRTKRSIKMINLKDAITILKKSSIVQDYKTIVPTTDENGLKIKMRLKKDIKIIMLESEDETINPNNVHDLNKRLYHITKLEKDGRIVARHHQEARMDNELSMTSTPFKINDSYREKIRLSISNLHCLVEGQDFIIDVLGQIKLLHQYNHA